ncbi:hypothetical protein [Nostoc sp.]
MALVQRAISFATRNQLLLLRSHFRETFGAIALLVFADLKLTAVQILQEL